MIGFYSEGYGRNRGTIQTQIQPPANSQIDRALWSSSLAKIEPKLESRIGLLGAVDFFTASRPLNSPG
jgi:hypothetical protein